MVPFAGFVFFILPAGSFYDSNLTREAGYTSDLSNIAGLLTPAMQNQESYYATLHRTGPTWNADGHRYVIELTSTQVLTSSVSVDTSGNISFTIVAFAQTFLKNRPVGESFFQVYVTLSTFTEADTPLPYDSSAEGFTVSFTKELDPNRPPPMNILLPLVAPLDAGANMANASQSVIYLPSSTASVVYRLTGAADGNPEEASGLYIRMCYLSAVTITTLGFGDITPVSSMARACVGLEAVLGVVLVGLFLNSVAQKWGKGAAGTPDLRLKFTLPSVEPNEARFVVSRGPGSPDAAVASECPAGIIVKNTSSYAARTPALIIEFRRAAIQARNYAVSRGWTPAARDPGTGDILALQWDGGPNYAIPGNSSRNLPELNLQGLSPSGTSTAEIVIRLLADWYSRPEIALPIEFLAEPPLFSTENVRQEWL